MLLRMQFVLILTKMGVGRQQQATWQELPEGNWALEAGQGTSLGAAALLQGLVSAVALHSCGHPQPISTYGSHDPATVAAVL